jgi:hypothetical protein
MRVSAAPLLVILDFWTSLRIIKQIHTLGAKRSSFAYLELAQRRSLPLATLDDELCTAAAAHGLRLLGRD